jgi:hypothetical protein
MILIPSEELIPLYVTAILDYYEKGCYKLSKDFFIQSYQKVGNIIKELG